MTIENEQVVFKMSTKDGRPLFEANGTVAQVRGMLIRYLQEEEVGRPTDPAVRLQQIVRTTPRDWHTVILHGHSQVQTYMCDCCGARSMRIDFWPTHDRNCPVTAAQQIAGRRLS